MKEETYDLNNNVFGTEFHQPIRDRMPTVAGQKKIGSIKFSEIKKQRSWDRVKFFQSYYWTVGITTITGHL